MTFKKHHRPIYAICKHCEHCVVSKKKKKKSKHGLDRVHYAPNHFDKTEVPYWNPAKEQEIKFVCSEMMTVHDPCLAELIPDKCPMILEFTMMDQKDAE